MIEQRRLGKDGPQLFPMGLGCMATSRRTTAILRFWIRHSLRRTSPGNRYPDMTIVNR